MKTASMPNKERKKYQQQAQQKEAKSQNDLNNAKDERQPSHGTLYDSVVGIGTAVSSYVFGADSADNFEEIVKVKLRVAFQELNVDAAFEDFENEHGKIGRDKDATICKHFKIFSSSILDCLNEFSSSVYLVFILRMSIRLLRFRRNLFMGNTSEIKDALISLNKVIIRCLEFIEDKSDKVVTIVESTEDTELAYVYETFRELIDAFSPTQNLFLDLLEDKNFFSFFVKCMEIRLCVERELRYRTKSPDSFPDDANKWLTVTIEILAKFKKAAMLTLDDARFVCGVIVSLRQVDARRRRIPQMLYMRNSMNFIRLRDIVINNLNLFTRDPTDTKRLIDTEVTLLKLFSPLIAVEENYINTIVRNIQRFSNIETIQVLCANLFNLSNAIDDADLYTPKRFNVYFRRQFIDFFISQLRSPISTIAILFATVSRNIPSQFREDWISALLRSLPLHRVYLENMTCDDVLQLGLIEFAPNESYRLCVEFVSSYLEIKINIISTKVASLRYMSVIKEHLSEITGLTQIINKYSSLFAYFTFENEIDKLLGFFTAILKGIASSIPIRQSESSFYVLAEFLKLVLQSDGIHDNAKHIGSNLNDLATPFRFNEALLHLKYVLRTQGSKKEFQNLVQEAEKVYSSLHTSVPILYSIACGSIATTMAQVVLFNVRNTVDQVSASCQFVEEAVLHPTRGLVGGMTYQVVPTILSMKIAHNACHGISALSQANPYELPIYVSVFIPLRQKLDKREFLKSCGQQEILVKFLTPIKDLIRESIDNVENSVVEANSGIEQLFEVVRSRIDQNYRDRLHDCPIRKTSLTALSSNFNVVKTVWESFNVLTLRNVGRSDMESAVAIFDKICAELIEWRCVDVWLRKKGFVPTATASTSLAADFSPEVDMSIKDILNYADSISLAWGLSSDCARTLRFFTKQHCNLFDTNFMKYLESHDQRANIQHLDKVQRNEVVSSLTNRSIRALENIIRDEELPLSSLAQGDIRGMMRALKGGRNDSILKELNVVAKYFQSLVEQQQQVTHSTTYRGRAAQALAANITIDRDVLTERMERLGAAVELLQLSESLPVAVDFIQSPNVLVNGRTNPSFQNLERLSTRIRDHDNIRLRNVRDLLQQVRDQLFGLGLHHLQLIGGLNGGYQLFLFMQSEPDIIGQIGILTQEMQGNPVHQGILNDLTLVHGFLLRLFPSLISRTAAPSPTWEDIARRLCTEKATVKTANEMHDALRSCILHVAEIATWFGGALGGVNADKIVANVVRFQREGRYFARTPHFAGGGAGLDLVYGDKQFRISDVRLQEQVKAAVFVCGDDSAVNTNGLNESQLTALRDFIHSHEKACEIMSRLADAEALGHPKYQSCEISLSDSISPRSLTDFLRSIREECETWDGSMEDAFDLSCRFALLTRSQVLKLLEAVKVSSADAVAAHLRLCFPDASDENDLVDSPTNFSTRIMTVIKDSVREMLDKLPLLDGGVSHTHLLDRTGTILTSLERTLQERMLLSDATPLFNEESQPKILRAIGMSNEALLRSMEASMNMIPMSSQLLWCDTCVNKIDIKRLLIAARKLQHVSFAIVAINELSVNLREYLLNELTVSEGENIGGLHGNILLIFTGQNGLDAFSFFPVNAGMDTVNIFEGLHTVRATDVFTNVAVVTGSAGSGKSMYVHRQFITNGVDQWKTLTVHEDFRPDAFIKWYNEVTSSGNPLRSIGIHINITPYGSLDRLARFLYSWFVFGLLEDGDSGRVTAMKSDIPHEIYIELPFLGAFEIVGKQHPFVEQISSLSIFTTSWAEINLKTFPLIIDDDLRLTAYYLKLYWSNALSVRFEKLQALLSAVPDGNISDDECRTILNLLFDTESVDRQIPETCDSVGKSHLQRISCLRLLSERVKFFSCLQKKVSDDLVKGYGDLLSSDVLENRNLSSRYFSHLMSLFIRESAALSDSSLQQDWSRLTIPFTVRYSSTDSTQLYFLCMSAQPEQGEIEPLRNSSCAVDGAEMRNSPGHLRAHFAPAFGVSNSGRLLNILKSQSYVMTPDFAVKMHVLFEKRRTKASTILRGETGTGKTELLSMLALLSNADDRLFPDLVFELRKVLQHLVEEGIFSHTEASHRVLFVKLSDETPMTKSVVIPARNGIPAATKVVGELWGSEDPQKLLNGVLQILEEENDELVTQLVPIFLREFRRVLRKYQMLRRSPWVKSVLVRDLHYRRQTGQELNDAADSDIEDESSDSATADGDDAQVSRNGGEGEVGGPNPTLRPRRGISSARELIDFIRDVVTTSPRNLFHCIRMHEGIKPSEFRELIRDIKKQAEKAMEISAKEGIPIELVAFIDELNTTSIMGMVKEVFIDHLLDGEPLPSNIFWVAAINPSSNVTDTREGKEQGAGVPSAGFSAKNFTGVISDSQDLRYIVKDLPKSMEPTVMEYSSLTTDQERDWISNYLNDTNLGLATELQNDSNKNYIISALRAGIISSQQFVRNARMERVEVSIRDMVRTVQLYRFLLLPESRVTFLPSVQGEQNREQQIVERERCWKALMVSLGLVYFFRLDTSRDLRSQYMIMLINLFEHDGLDGRGAVDVHRDLSSSLPFDMVLTQSIDKLWGETKRPRGIAPTRGLKENLFATVVCVEACIPLIITGPPGTGKTLSFQIASRNMKGISAASAAYKRLKLVQPFTYQCSQQSTASEIKDVYEAALARRQRFLSAGITSERCVVFMDEAGLPSERRAALKSIHFYTDHALVASVMLTNQTLDAAKTNRAVQLLQSETTRDDLMALAQGSLFDYDVTDDAHRLQRVHGVPPIVKNQIQGLCDAYSDAKRFCDIPGHPDAYHLRDFIYLCRFIRHCDSQASIAGGQFSLFSAPTLIHALRRTFNGISDSNFRSMVLMFLSKTNLEQEAMGMVRRDGDFHSMLGPEVMESLRDALRDQLNSDEDPNQSHFRHIMLIDNSSSENAISLLFDMNVLDKLSTEVFQVSDFKEDTSDLNRSALISRIKTAVETGKTIVLANSQSIISAFFDLVNKHYMPVGARSKGLVSSVLPEHGPTEAMQEPESTELYYANISMGSFSRPCVVHPKTKIIVHIPVSQMPFTPVPFLNRFDKFRISVVDVMNEALAQLAKNERQSTPSDSYPLSQLYRHIYDGVEDFVRTFNGKTMMYGLVEKETVAALIMRSIQSTLYFNSISPIIQRPFHVELKATEESYNKMFSSDEIESDETEAESAAGSENDQHRQEDRLRAVAVVKNIRKFVREINFQLLQYARPEHVFLARGVLPAAYIREYLNQEHFSASNFIRFLVRKHWDRPLSLEPLSIDDACGHKFIIFVRTSAVLYRLKQSATLQRALLPSSYQSALSIRIIHLGSYTVSASCMSDIARFVEVDNNQIHRRLLLVIADRSIVSTSQVNSTIRKIDQMLSLQQGKESLPLVVVVQHFPSESLQFGSLYDSLPFNGWDMQYCDSFQLDLSEKEIASVETREPIRGAMETKEPEQQMDNENDSRDSVNDARRWMRVAYGLEKAPSPADAVSEFQQVFLDELQISLSSTTVPREDEIGWKGLQARGILKSFALYANKPDKITRVLRIFQERPYITATLLRRFTTAWSSELVASVLEAAQELITGRSLDSMLGKVRGSFQILLRAFSRYSIISISKNYGFESISNLLTEKELVNGEKSAATFAMHVICGLNMPAAEDLRLLGTAPKTLLGSEFKFPPRLPMYTEFLVQIRRLQAAAVISIVGDEGSMDDNITRMYELLPRYASLQRAFERIERSPLLLENLIHDKLLCSSGFGELPSYELSVAIHLIMLEVKYNSTVLKVLYDGNVIDIAIRVASTLRPMRKILPADTDKNYYLNMLGDIDMNIANNNDVGALQLLSYLQEQVVNLLWKRRNDIFSNDIVTLQSWIEAIRELSSPFESFSSTVEYPGMNTSGAICVTVFKFILQALSTGCSIAALRERLIGLIQLDLHSPIITDSLFIRLLTALPIISSTVNAADQKSALTFQTEELVRWFTGVRFSSSSLADVETVLASLGSDATESPQTVPFKSVSVLVQIRWLTHMLDSPIEGILMRINDELSRHEGPNFFLPENIKKATAHVRSKRAGTEGPNELTVGQGSVDPTFRALVFQAILEQYRASRFSFNVEELLRLFANDRQMTLGISVLNAFRVSALAVHIVEVAATQWAEGGNSQAFIESLSDRLLDVFGFMDGLMEYFFLCLRSESVLIRFFSSRDILRRFRLDESWFVQAAVEGTAIGLSVNEVIGWMPFMVVENHEHYAIYNLIASIIRCAPPVNITRLTDWVRDQVQQGRKFLCRMMIFVVAFHECFMKGRSCSILLEFLANQQTLALLDITAVEALAYLQIARGPCPDALTPDDGIRYLFSSESMRDRSDWMISRRNCAVNAMALMIGSPSEKSYYYMICFDNRARQSFGLGSGYGLYAKDCGYQVELDTFKDLGTQRLIPFRNIRRYRALNNYLVWIAYAWGQWIREDRDAVFEWAVTHRERFNLQGVQGEYAAQEQRRMQQLNSRQQTAINMLSRAHAYLGFLETDADILGSGIHPMLFATLAIYETAKSIVLSDAALGFFPNNDGSLPLMTTTMNFLIDTCWEPAFAGAVAIMRLYDRRSRCDATIKILLDASKISVFYGIVFSFPSRNGAEQALGRLVVSGDGGEQAAGPVLACTAAKYVSEFLQMTLNFEMGSHMHLLVHLYNWLHSVMAYRFTVEESLELTAWDAVGRLEEPSEKEKGRTLLTQFESAWNQMRNVFQIYMDCNDAQARGESDIPFVNVRQIRIGELLSQDARDVVDLINRMLDGRLVRQQNTHLGSYELCSLLQQGDANNDLLDAAPLLSLNRLGCLADKLPEELDIRFLPSDQKVMATATIIVSKADQQELEEFITSHTRTDLVSLPNDAKGFRTEADAVSIARYIIKRHTAGRRFLRMEKLRTTFLRRSEDLINLPIDSDSDEKQPETSSVQRKPHQHLYCIATALETYWQQGVETCADPELKKDLRETLTDIFGEEIRRLETPLVRCSESVGADLLLYLAAVVEVARAETPEIGQCERLGSFIRSKISTLQVEHNFKVSEARTLVNIMKMLSIVSLPAICRRIVTWWEGQEFLFADLGRDFSKQLDEETITSFHVMAAVAVLGSQDEVNRNLEVMQAVAETMLREEFRRNVRLYGADRPLADALRNDLNLPAGPIQEMMVALLTSDSVETRHYAHLMRLVRGACGDMALHLRNMSTISARNTGDNESSRRGGYIEMVPERFAVIQELLDFSAPLDLGVTEESAVPDHGEMNRSISSDWQDVGDDAQPTIAIELDLRVMEPITPPVIPLHKATHETFNVPLKGSGEKQLVKESPPMKSTTQRVDDWIDVANAVSSQMQPPKAVLPDAPPPPVVASTAEAPSATKKLVKKLTVENFASQAGMLPSDIDFLIQRELLPSQHLAKIGIRLPESALASLDVKLVKLSEISLSSEAATERGLRVMMRGNNAVVVAADWENSRPKERILSGFELASQLSLRPENLLYLYKQGLLELHYGEEGSPGLNFELDLCHAKQSAVEGMAERLREALASEEDVLEILECVGVEETELVNTLQSLGHDSITYEGSFRILKNGLRALIVEWKLEEVEE